MAGDERSLLANRLTVLLVIEELLLEDGYGALNREQRHAVRTLLRATMELKEAVAARPTRAPKGRDRRA
jgi:hypothetical protein